MACPTCDETMQGLTGGWFWCPTCGTVKRRDSGEFTDLDLPRMTFFAVNPATNVGRFEAKLAEVLERRKRNANRSELDRTAEPLADPNGDFELDDLDTRHETGGES